MSRWSESIYSEPNSSREVYQGFLTQLDARLYEGVPMSDPLLDAEAGEWAARFLHLRVRGTKCNMSLERPEQDRARHGENEVEKEAQSTVRPSLTRTNTKSTPKKNAVSTAQARPTRDSLPKLKNLKTQ
ncbi:unnamed protein product [Heligmosomoides polygyrus]|uniref:DUF3719 domain-containing protein n=1 Tax=Heligmosomoides polygyrus TaxID=6339 RepID=A0A183G1D5_HELPZ|nr:unnamed protein product [Heligmosomoides polygyrus]